MQSTQTLPTFFGLSLFLLAISQQSTRAQDVNLTGNQTFNITSTYSQITEHDTSQSIGTSGNVLQIFTYDNSSVTNNGSTIQNILTFGSNTITLNGGTVTDISLLTSAATLNFRGGTSNIVDIEADASATISGGTLRVLDDGVNDITVTGGTIQNANTLLAGNTTLFGTGFVVLDSSPATQTNSKFTYTGMDYTLSCLLQNNSTVSTINLFDAATQTSNTTGTTVSEPGKFILHDVGTGNIIVLSAASATTPEPEVALLCLAGCLPLAIGTIRRRA